MKSIQDIVVIIMIVTLSLLCSTQDVAAKDWSKYKQNKNSRNLGKVHKLRAALQDEGILLSWKSVRGCDGYRIYHDIGKKVSRNANWFDVDSEQTTYLFVADEKEQKYSFKVSALRGRREGPRSAKVTAKMPKVENKVETIVKSDVGI